MKHVVMFSGGLGSWVTARRVAERHGTDNLFLVFADVGGQHTSPHAGEDEDTYRFINEAAANVGGTLVTLNEGRDVWQVFTDNRFLGNSRLANCSKFLKQQPARAWLDSNCDPDDTTVYVGIDWTETHRLPAIVNAYQPYKAEAPLTEAPYLSREDMQAMCVPKASKFHVSTGQGSPTTTAEVSASGPDRPSSSYCYASTQTGTPTTKPRSKGCENTSKLTWRSSATARAEPQPHSPSAGSANGSSRNPNCSTTSTGAAADALSTNHPKTTRGRREPKPRPATIQHPMPHLQRRQRASLPSQNNEAPH